MASPFSRLPLEVLTIILQYAPDLPTIYRFISASANANTAFKLSPAPILDNAIERSIPEFRHLARMVAILGSLSASPSHIPTFRKLINKFNRLPKDVLTTACLAPFAFAKKTPGPRYLVLTAYRIETLQHICFIYLLQNIHEVIWRVEATDEKESHFYPVKQSKDDICFQAAAWWSPSWAEKLRLTRAFWKLIIYWNIQAICPDLPETDDQTFSQYRAKIKQISSLIGPHMPKYDDKRSFFKSHEFEEIKCALAATRVFLKCMGCQCDSFTPFTSHDLHHKWRLEKWTSSNTFKETSAWKSEEPVPMKGVEAEYHGQQENSVNEINSSMRFIYWDHWDHWDLHHDKNFQFPDYLGLCIWDYKRLGYLGITYTHHKFIDPCLGPPRKPTDEFFASASIEAQWRELLMQEVHRLPGGQLRKPSKELSKRIEDWDKIPSWLKNGIDSFREEIDWCVSGQGPSRGRKVTRS